MDLHGPCFPPRLCPLTLIQYTLHLSSVEMPASGKNSPKFAPNGHSDRQQSSKFIFSSLSYALVLLAFVTAVLKYSGITEPNGQSSALAQTIPILILIQIVYSVSGALNILSIHEHSRKRVKESLGSRLSVCIFHGKLFRIFCRTR